MESQPQNPEFRIVSENFHPWVQSIQWHVSFLLRVSGHISRTV